MTSSKDHRLTVEPLQASAFASFGDVIDVGLRGDHRTINEGFADRYDLARLDTNRHDGQAVLSVFRAKPRALPMQLRLVERHTFGSQAFVPMHAQRFLVVVAAPGPAPVPTQLRCFLASAGQGVQYAAGTWHHPLIALDEGGDFLVVDRAGPAGAADDCDEHPLQDVWVAL